VHERLATSLLFLQVFMAVVSVTTLSLSVAIAERNQAIKSREWLLASVSHDLKNPLNMVGLSAAMLERLLPVGNEALRRQIANIDAASARMNALVRDLLDLSSIEAGHFSIDREHVEASGLIDEAVAATRAVAAGRSQTLHTAIPPQAPSVVCDRRRIVQVLVNLIDNAIKFSPAKSEIKVTIDGDQSAVRFTVTDVGPGIAASDARQVFQPFWRAPNTSQPGSGIGLAIAKTIVDAHGGRIWVTSRVGAATGSSFCFSLPSAPRQ
jgi:signal transduction histidine kinase